MSKQNKKSPGGNTIAVNRRAKFDYHLEDRFEAGLALEGWEVKAMRDGRAQLVDSYVLIRNGEAFLLGARINPSPSASTHQVADPDRMRKLLLHRRELARIIGAVSTKGYTCVATSLYWKGPLAKCEIALAKGKREVDKRQDKKEKDWQREKARILKAG
ncbi:MAG: SsrA-binding protein SmpB [Pseudomonadales bacterium]|nr:SsrA-binding protein SmpB [Pseudomonadales bacterium]